MTVHSPEPTFSPDSTETAGRADARARLLRYAFMKLTRDLDSRFEALLLTGRVSKWYSEVGSEATTIPAGLALEAGDALCTLHRDLGAILAVYLDPARAFPGFGFGEADGRRPEPDHLMHRLACQLLGKGEGFSQGVERSFHYGYLAPKEGILHLGMISHLGAMIPVAAGCAFAFKQAGGNRIAVNFIGEGGTSTGDFHEGLNMAAVWKLPLILVIENNGYAFSTPARLQYAARRLSDRGIGYGVAAETVDGNDPDAMAAAYARAVARARAGEGPTLIEAMLGRMRGHAEGDDSLKVVPADELDAYRAADPVPAYAKRLEEEGVLTADIRQRLEARIAEMVESAITRAIDAPPPADDIALRPVFAPEPSQKIVEAPAILTRSKGEITYVDAINQALLEEMERDPSVVLMGQDIGVFEGAFRTTKGLHARWPNRVYDTPIAESGTIGIAIGAALLGYRPVVEMQFGDFITCGFNQLVNVAAKLFYRWQVPCPIVIRLPTGGGVGAGPFHSQNPEGWFAMTPGIKVVCPATATDAMGLLKAAIRDPNPVMLFEHKYLYRRIKSVMPDGDAVARLGEAKVMRRGTHLTLIGYGASTWTCMEAADELAKSGVEAEVIDLRTLVPYDEETVLASVKRTGRALVVHEAPLTEGFGAEIAARLADAAFPWLDAPIRRVTYPDRPVPYAKNLEKVLLPDKGKVLAAARELMAF
ncbi:MAG TPA: dehydrogenase E1 component subunit alpha/beta [Thermoanaerobaculia bacterium]|jgi:2-oxoisovalerate dehydrogenase E1 component|nr:dehydrogenase E1 component subunit alpha/beta [Thermoanaerobaculia bacterium]